ncbi:unnamed protein product [Amoebophrya sp. A120]|nr:unnamed protein product [Amoebophrya sp. A120]|eukprot:GSA120T00014653001.1
MAALSELVAERGFALIEEQKDFVKIYGFEAGMKKFWLEFVTQACRKVFPDPDNANLTPHDDLNDVNDGSKLAINMFYKPEDILNNYEAPQGLPTVQRVMEFWAMTKNKAPNTYAFAPYFFEDFTAIYQEEEKRWSPMLEYLAFFWGIMEGSKEDPDDSNGIRRGWRAAGAYPMMVKTVKNIVATFGLQQDRQTYLYEQPGIVTYCKLYKYILKQEKKARRSLNAKKIGKLCGEKIQWKSTTGLRINEKNGDTFGRIYQIVLDSEDCFSKGGMDILNPSTSILQNPTFIDTLLTKVKSTTAVKDWISIFPFEHKFEHWKQEQLDKQTEEGWETQDNTIIDMDKDAAMTDCFLCMLYNTLRGTMLTAWFVTDPEYADYSEHKKKFADAMSYKSQSAQAFCFPDLDEEERKVHEPYFRWLFALNKLERGDYNPMLKDKADTLGGKYNSADAKMFLQDNVDEGYEEWFTKPVREELVQMQAAAEEQAREDQLADHENAARLQEMVAEEIPTEPVIADAEPEQQAQENNSDDELWAMEDEASKPPAVAADTLEDPDTWFRRKKCGVSEDDCVFVTGKIINTHNPPYKKWISKDKKQKILHVFDVNTAAVMGVKDARWPFKVLANERVKVDMCQNLKHVVQSESRPAVFFLDGASKSCSNLARAELRKISGKVKSGNLLPQKQPANMSKRATLREGYMTTAPEFPIDKYYDYENNTRFETRSSFYKIDAARHQELEESEDVIAGYTRTCEKGGGDLDVSDSDEDEQGPASDDETQLLDKAPLGVQQPNKDKEPEGKEKEVPVVQDLPKRTLYRRHKTYAFWDDVIASFGKGGVSILVDYMPHPVRLVCSRFRGMKYVGLFTCEDVLQAFLTEFKTHELYVRTKSKDDEIRGGSSDVMEYKRQYIMDVYKVRDDIEIQNYLNKVHFMKKEYPPVGQQSVLGHPTFFNVIPSISTFNTPEASNSKRSSPGNTNSTLPASKKPKGEEGKPKPPMKRRTPMKREKGSQDADKGTPKKKKTPMKRAAKGSQDADKKTQAMKKKSAKKDDKLGVSEVISLDELDDHIDNVNAGAAASSSGASSSKVLPPHMVFKPDAAKGNGE